MQCEVRIAGSVGDGLHRARGRESIRILHLVGQDRQRIVEEREVDGRVGNEEAAQRGLPQIVETELIGVLAGGDRHIVLELPFPLVALLRHVGVGAEGGRRKVEGRNLVVRVDQVVPILVTDRRRVHNPRRQHRVQRRIGDDELVGGEIPGREVAVRTYLIVQPAVVLIGVAQRKVVTVVEAMIEPAVVAPVEIGRRDGR